MTPVLIVIPFNASNAVQAETLIDFMFELESKQQTGSCLLFVDPNVHGELRERVRISAEIAFSHCDLVEASGMSKNPAEEISAIINDRYKSPWFLMEPDCVPLKKGWRDKLSVAYESQPCKFMGIKQQRKVQNAVSFRVHPTAIYPPDGSLTTDKGVVARTSVTSLISLMNFQHGMTLDKIDQNAVVLKGDPNGDVIRMMRDGKVESASDSEPDHEPLTSETRTLVRTEDSDTLPNRQESSNGHVRPVFIAESLEEAVRITKTKARNKPGRKKKEALNG